MRLACTPLLISLCITGIGSTALAVSTDAQTPTAPATPPAKRAASPTATTTTLSITVTDGKGAPLGNARVTASGPVAREADTDSNGTLRLQGLRTGTYRFRFEREGFITLERDVTVPARQASMDQHVMLSTAPAPPPPPPAPAPGVKQAALPPPGKAVTLSLPDFIEKNLIAANAPQKVSALGCSGLVQSSLWQIREPWENRQHANADAILYAVAGEGTLRLEGRDVPLQAGGFATVPRGSSYGVSRRGRNPLILLATLGGEACTP